MRLTKDQINLLREIVALNDLREPYQMDGEAPLVYDLQRLGLCYAIREYVYITFAGRKALLEALRREG